MPFTGITEGDLRVRPLADSPEDIGTLARWLSDERVLAFYEGRDNPFDEARVRATFLHGMEPGETPCMVEYQGRAIGYVQFYPVAGEELAEYGYRAGARVFGMDQFIGEPDLWGRGIGSRMIRVVVGYLFGQGHAERVVMDPITTNSRAIRAYERCGFRKVKLLPEHELHEGAYRDSWLVEVTPETFRPA